MINLAVLSGRVSRPVTERALPSGDRLVTLDLAVPTTKTLAKASSVPLAWINGPTWLQELAAGDEIVVIGRVNRRFYRAGSGLQSRTEVIVEAGARADRRAVAKKIVDEGVRELEELRLEVEARGRRASRTFP
jgi:hypothetical protein